MTIVDDNLGTLIEHDVGQKSIDLTLHPDVSPLA